MKNLDIRRNFKYMAKTCYDIDVINENANDIKPFVKYCENNYKQQIKEIVKKTLKPNIKMILLAGPSSSGKTTTANLISQAMNKKGRGSIVISMDDFFIDADKTPLLPNGIPDYENISALDIDCFNKFFLQLLKTGKAKMPKFNFQTHKRDHYETVKINESDIIIVEGIHALNPVLLNSYVFDPRIFKVFVCSNSVFNHKNKIIATEKDLRLMRRIYRDTFTRGRDALGTLDQWQNVCLGEDLYITPYRSYAHAFVDSTHAYELMIYANYLQSLLKSFEHDQRAKNIIGTLKHVYPMDKKITPANSLLWEFIVNKE